MVNYSKTRQKIHALLEWWIAGLYLLIPVSLRNKIFQLPDTLTIEVDDEDLLFRYFHGNEINAVHQRRMKLNDVLAKAGAGKWLADTIEPDASIMVLVKENQILSKFLSLPLAGDTDLREILGFEMDRQTPFTSEQVYYDYQVMERDYQNKKLQVKLYVLPRNAVDPVLQQIRNLGLGLDGIHIDTTKGTNRDINFMPVGHRGSRKSAIDNRTRTLIVSAVLLFLAALYLPVFRYHGILNALENEVARSRAEALEVSPLMKEKDLILARNQFLSEKLSGRTPDIETLAELTRILPDNTSLNRLIVAGDNIQLEGESDAAIAILPLIEQSSLFSNAQFRSPVTRDGATNKDRFQISVELAGKGSR